jgi:cytoskeletal protein RodZ
MRGRRDQPNEEKTNAPGPTPWEQGDGGSFGSWLRQQREIRNISLREISDNTKIGMRYLEALEDDRFEVLPAAIFAKGFLREYAKYVGLDADEVVNFYIAADQRRRAELDETETVVPRPQVRPGHSRMPDRLLPRLPVPVSWLVSGLVGLLLLALLATWLVRRVKGGAGGDPPAPPPIAAPVAEPAPPLPMGTPPPPQRPAIPTDSLLVNLTFTAECWVEAVVDGSQRISELRVQGESMQIPARESVVLTLGNAGSVRVEVNGRPLQLGSAPGQVVRDMVIDRGTAGLPPLAPTPGPGGGGGP